MQNRIPIDGILLEIRGLFKSSVTFRKEQTLLLQQRTNEIDPVQPAKTLWGRNPRKAGKQRLKRHRDSYLDKTSKVPKRIRLPNSPRSSDTMKLVSRLEHCLRRFYQPCRFVHRLHVLPHPWTLSLCQVY